LGITPEIWAKYRPIAQKSIQSRLETGSEKTLQKVPFRKKENALIPARLLNEWKL